MRRSMAAAHDDMAATSLAAQLHHVRPAPACASAMGTTYRSCCRSPGTASWQRCSNMAAQQAHNNQPASSANQDGRNSPRLQPGRAANMPAHQGRAACNLRRHHLQDFLSTFLQDASTFIKQTIWSSNTNTASARTTRSARSPADAAAARPPWACKRARTARMPSVCMPWCPHASCPHVIVPASQVRQPAPRQSASQQLLSGLCQPASSIFPV